MVDDLLKMDNLYENLDLEEINKRISSIKDDIFYSTRNLEVFDSGKVGDPLEMIIEKRISALE
jgi:hypothetical protein